MLCSFLGPQSKLFDQIRSFYSMLLRMFLDTNVSSGAVSARL